MKHPLWLDIVWWIALVTNLISSGLTIWRYWRLGAEWESIGAETKMVAAENHVLRALLRQLGVEVTVTREPHGLHVEAIQHLGRPPDASERVQ